MNANNRPAVALLLALGITVGAQAADHREAPLIIFDRPADIADIYVFHNPDNLNNVVLVMTVNPFIATSDNTSNNFSPDVAYRFKIDNTGDAVADEEVNIRFTPTVPGPQRFVATLPGGVQIRGLATPPTVEPVANPPLIFQGTDGSRAFAGPRDDPFFFDFVGFQRFLAGTGGFSGVDSFSGYNVSAIVIELPIASVSGGSNSLQIWGETSRNQLTLRRAAAPLRVNLGGLLQIERMGNPAVNTALITPDLKDLYNAGLPENDASSFAQTIVASLQSLGTNSSNIGVLSSLVVPDTLKLDLQAPDGYPNGRRLEDDVIDTLFFYIFNQQGVADGVDRNDIPFLSAFPFLAPPHQPQF